MLVVGENMILELVFERFEKLGSFFLFLEVRSRRLGSNRVARCYI